MSQLLLHFTPGTCLSTASHVRVVVDGWSLEHSPSIGCTRVLAPAYPVKPVIIMCQTLSLTVDFAIVVVVVVVVVVWVCLCMTLSQSVATVNVSTVSRVEATRTRRACRLRACETVP